MQGTSIEFDFWWRDVGQFLFPMSNTNNKNLLTAFRAVAWAVWKETKSEETEETVEDITDEQQAFMDDNELSVDLSKILSII